MVVFNISVEIGRLMDAIWHTLAKALRGFIGTLSMETEADTLPTRPFARPRIQTMDVVQEKRLLQAAIRNVDPLWSMMNVECAGEVAYWTGNAIAVETSKMNAASAGVQVIQTCARGVIAKIGMKQITAIASTLHRKLKSIVMPFVVNKTDLHQCPVSGHNMTKNAKNIPANFSCIEEQLLGRHIYDGDLYHFVFNLETTFITTLSDS